VAMIEILEFMFRDFWTWLGSFLMLCVIASMPCSLVKIVTNKTENKEDKNDR
jgi:hypothetical protein